jgi:ABC-2 type transport system ATP-binding protein
MCDRVAFIQEGKIIKVEDLKKADKYTSNMAYASSQLDELKKFFKERNMDYKSFGEDSLQVTVKNNEIEELTSCIFKRGIPVKGIYEVKESLEERYLKTMGDEKDA